ncbi:MAG: GNAT family N-acetyltransferase [Ilumatobacter sp.]|uniref:GNAT family N-acetyltransferase n=1 Tax=Ilumatobacter sp. TaxID=1967498 RepID=UPI002621BAA5|nr:GNAT family N-acetyltransferase [Ilumatobacter sp.]MDJ0770909.1 GNAT family N-acetyltransferase [Ilumatobacter sp.]
MQAHLAQINIGTMVAPTDDPAVAEFMDNLDRVNKLADESEGFVWRLQTDSGNATDIQIFPNPLELVNMSVWESVDALKAYVYRSDHVDFFRRRAEWFQVDAKRVALWWIPAGTVPELDEAVRRVEFQERHGPSPYSFGFARQPEQLVIHETRPGDPATLDLVSRSNAELTALYDHPDANHFSLADDEVTGDRGAMITARLDAIPVACGAVRRLDDGRGEIKRMFVDPAVRGQRLGAAILDQLELRATRLGIDELVLETGVHQHAAISLYEANGYTPAELWGEYVRSAETSRAYRKLLR